MGDKRWPHTEQKLLSLVIQFLTSLAKCLTRRARDPVVRRDFNSKLALGVVVIETFLFGIEG